MRNHLVYCHTSPSGKRYVGITCTSAEQRWSNGSGYKKNFYFYRAIQKYGWDSFQHTILFEGLTLEEAKSIEIRLIKEWNLTDKQFGYNLREGGDGSFTIESRMKMSASRIGNKNCVGRMIPEEQRIKISNSLKAYYSTHSNPFKGKHHREETKEKLRAREVTAETRARMRKNHADVSGKANPSAKPVVQLSLEGEIIKRYDYASQAAKELSLDLSSIIKCCRGKKKTCGGYRWAYDINIPESVK